VAKTKFEWVAGEEPVDDGPPGRGRSKRKREAKAVEALVDELLRLSPGALAVVPLSDETRVALEQLEALLARGGVRSGLRRQRLAVAGLLRREDLDAVRDALG